MFPEVFPRPPMDLKDGANARPPSPEIRKKYVPPG